MKSCNAVCAECGKPLQAKPGPGRPQTFCKECARVRAGEKSKQWKQENKERVSAHNSAYYAAHQEELADYRKIYNKAYYQAHREEIIAKQSERSKHKKYEYSVERAEKMKAYNKAYYQAHREEIVAKRKAKRKKAKEG